MEPKEWKLVVIHRAISKPITREIMTFVWGLLFSILVSHPTFVVAEERTFPQASPEDLGLRIPKAPVKIVEQELNVLIATEDLGPVVCKVYLNVGSHFVVIRPDGRLIAVDKREARQTDRPFQSMGKTELAAELLKRFPGFRTRSTKRYLYVYNTSEPFVKGTSRILETMFPGLFVFCNRHLSTVSEPELPLVVVMFKTEKEFQRYRHMPAGVVAYYNSLSNHIVLYEQSNLANIAPDLALKQSISTIAHEGVHQILHNIGVQKRLSSWPLWFSEGLAEYFAPTDCKNRVRWKGVGHANDLRMHEIFRFYRQQRRRTTHGQLLRQTVESNSINSLGYATSWAMVHYLSKRQKKAFQSFFVDVSQAQPLKRSIPGKLFAKHFQLEFDELEPSVLNHINSLPYRDPMEFQTHFVLFSQNRNRRHVIVTTSPAEVRRFHEEQSGKNVSFKIQAFENRSVASRYAKILSKGGK